MRKCEMSAVWVLVRGLEATTSLLALVCAGCSCLLSPLLMSLVSTKNSSHALTVLKMEPKISGCWVVHIPKHK